MTRPQLAVARAGSSLRLLCSPCRRGSPFAARMLAANSPLSFSTSRRTLDDRSNWKSALEVPSGLQKTYLYDFHIENGAKMVPFSGYHMPVQYASHGLVESHNFTRNHASLFDVSHMVQHKFFGKNAAAFLEKVTPSGIADMEIGQGKLTTLLWPKTGGIVDDTMVTRLGPTEFFMVTNGATREKVFKYLTEQISDLQVPPYEDFFWAVQPGGGLIALQGPGSAEILQEFLPSSSPIDLSKLYFGQAVNGKLKLSGKESDSNFLISRGGYTGEDGFEISFRDTDAGFTLAKGLLEHAGPEKLQLAGLGARDSLRLEAGMCLYGHDLDDTTTPVEAGLSWIIPPERRKKGGFHGADVICKQLIPKSKGGLGVERRRVGFNVQGAPAREGAEIHTKEGEKIGVVTSGSPSPTLGKYIAMGYVKDGLHKSGTELDIVIRGKKRASTVTKMPFVPTKYYKGPTPAPA